MYTVDQLEKIVKLGGKIAESEGKNVFLSYLKDFLNTGFDKNLFLIMLMKYHILTQEYLDIIDMLEDKEVLKLLISSILHSI